MMARRKWEQEVIDVVAGARAGTAIEAEGNMLNLGTAESQDSMVLFSGGQGVALVAVGRKTGAIEEVSTGWSFSVGGVPLAGAEDRIRTLEARVAALEQEVEGLRRLALEEQEGDVIVLRSASREQAKQEIRELFASGETLYYSDIVQRLGLDIDLVVGLCKELEEAGEVETLGDAA